MKNSLDNILQEAKDTFDYTVEELSFIRGLIIKYTTKVLLDSETRDEFNKEIENNYVDQ